MQWVAGLVLASQSVMHLLCSQYVCSVVTVLFVWFVLY